MNRIAADVWTQFADEQDIQLHFSIALRSDSLIFVSLDSHAAVRACAHWIESSFSLERRKFLQFSIDYALRSEELFKIVNVCCTGY
jgi:hypothetical protein